MLPNDNSVYDKYFSLLREIGGDLASILTLSVMLALEPVNTEAHFEDWYGLIAMFLAQNEFQISDQNIWDYLRRQRPHLAAGATVNTNAAMFRVEQEIRTKYPYLHFWYGQSGGYKAFQQILILAPGTTPARKLTLLKLLVQYWPNHLRATGPYINSEASYLKEAWVLGPEFIAVLDPNKEVFTEAWVEDNAGSLGYYSKMLKSQPTPEIKTEATTKTV